MATKEGQILVQNGISIFCLGILGMIAVHLANLYFRQPSVVTHSACEKTAYHVGRLVDITRPSHPTADDWARIQLEIARLCPELTR